MLLSPWLGRLGISAAVLAFGACVQAGAATLPVNQMCQGPGLALARVYGSNAQLIAGFTVTASQFAAWQERTVAGAPRIVGSTWRNRPAQEQVSLCYYGGTFDHLYRPAGPPGNGPLAQFTYDRIRIVVDASGSADLFTAGRASTLTIEDPALP